MTTANATKPALSREQISALPASTIAFAVNFAVWVMFSIIGVKIKAELNLSETEFGLLVATPILTGSLIRLPLGILTDRYGGRIVYFFQMLAVVIPTWLLSYATEYWQYLVLGLFVGVAGGSFAVGIAYTSAWFSKERQGTAMPTHSLRNVILRAVGTSESLAVDILRGKGLPGDIFLLCSDGLHDMVRDEGICDIIASQEEIQAKAARLVEAARSAGGYDNITVALCEVLASE